MTEKIQVNLSSEDEILGAIEVITKERDELIAQIERTKYDTDYPGVHKILENAKATCETMIALFDEILRLREIIKHLRGGSLE